MNTEFEKFVTFGSILDEAKRAKMAKLIREVLNDPAKEFPNLVAEGAENFAQAIGKIFSHDAMREMCAQDETLADKVAGDIFDFINNTKRKMWMTKNPFEAEMRHLETFTTVEVGGFESAWENLKPFLKETYSSDALNSDFYHEQFQNSIRSVGTDDLKPEGKISFQSVKEHFIERWEQLLHAKQLKWELDIIEEERKRFCEELYKRIDDLKKMRQLLQPFTGELGWLWDMSRGQWQKVDFDILQKYADLLQHDKSLQELVEMLGRMRQAEKEYEDETFTDVVIKPDWKLEHASKSDLIGVHESDDISSMLPIEAGLLADTETEALFFKKFTEKKLQTFEYQGRILGTREEEIQRTRQKAKEEAKGPIIVCVDTSGSMQGTPEVVAKTLCFALLKIAIRENRKCYLISFSTGIETLNMTDFKRGLDKLIQFLSMSFCGGTDATPAMHEALRMLETEDYKKADVVMVSDFVMAGLDMATKKAIAAAKEKKTKFHSLVIGGGGNQAAIAEFDSNWYYDANNANRVLQLVRDISGL